MAIGRTFKEALQKALRSLEIKRFGLIGDGKDAVIEDDDALRTKLTVPNAERIFYVGLAFQRGWTVDCLFELTKIDRWFLENIREIVEESVKLGSAKLKELTALGSAALAGKYEVSHSEGIQLHEFLRRAKKLGFSDRQIAIATGSPFAEVRKFLRKVSILPTYRLVDTCAAEFEAYTPYYYSTYGDENERRESGKQKVITVSYSTPPGYYLGTKDPMPKQQLQKELEELFQRTPDTDLVIKADQRLKYGEVKEVMRITKEAGFQNVGLIAQKKAVGIAGPTK